MAEKKPKMTEGQFMKELSEHKGKLFMREDGLIRSRPMKLEQGGQMSYCPITKVCKAITGELFRTSHYISAAKKIGLTKKVAKRIAGAADRPPHKCGANQKDVRRQMLEVLGLKEKETA